LKDVHVHRDEEPMSVSTTDLEQAALLLRAARRVAVLTGAGISAESGLATFRGAGGLWEGQRVEDVATPRAFRADPALVWRFYNLRRASLALVKPNPGHDALAHLEKLRGNDFTLVTQNVDGLHQLAGNKNVLEIHGTIRRVRCTSCEFIENRGTEALPDLPKCDQCGSLLRPDVVWFEEMLPEHVWDQAEQAVRHCQCLIVVGTSAQVYPAAGLIDMAQENHAKVIEINLNTTPATSLVHLSLQGPSGKILPDLIASL
jgi:NAD-dependent deacetylase